MLSYSLPIGVCIAALILIVITSYRQTIRAYPRGGGAYIVAKDNLGTNVALVAGGALLIDYVLTVAVSVTAGVEAITSAIPVLLPYRIWLSVGAIALITTVNLRGVRESGHVFAAPTYLFVVSIRAMIGWGRLRRLPPAVVLPGDRFIPRQFATQGDRLVFSNGIVILAALATALVIAFHGDTQELLPLYAIGLFISFTVSQAGMVRRWLRLKGEGWAWRIWFSLVGAVVTAIVLVTLAVTKFLEGAWIVVILIPTLVILFLVVRRHYDTVAEQLSLEDVATPLPLDGTILVLVGDLHRGVVRALQYAQSLSPSARAVYVETDPERTRRLEERWTKWGMGVPLVVLNSPYPLAAGAANGLHRPAATPARTAPHRYDRRAGVHPGPVVAAVVAQPRPPC